MNAAIRKSHTLSARNAFRLALLTVLLAGLGLPKPSSAEAEGSGTNIYNQSSGLVADVVAAGTANGQAIVLWSQNSSAQNQQFEFVDPGDGQGYKIVARHSGKCLDVSGWSKADGAKVIQWDCHGGANQRWEFVDIGDPKSCPPGSGGCAENALGYLIVSKNSGKCLDAGNGDFPSPPRLGAGLQQWACAGSTGDPWWVNQAWRLGDEPAPLPPMPADAKQIIDQVVQARRGACADPSVRLDPRLSEVARRHSADLAANYASLIDAYPRGDPRRGHIGSDNTMPADRIGAAGFSPAQRPENWSYGTNQTFAQAMDNWLNHDEASNWGHRQAILACDYKVLGVGTANGHNNRVYWTENFARG
ncbi:RICIN domain-containing protein [Streptomyces sp. NPDC001450]